MTLYNPTTEQAIAELSSATPADADAAIAKAKAAGPVWRAISPADRSRLMRRYGDLIAEHAQELGELETRNMGMTIGNSVWCANNASDVIHYFAGAIEKHGGSTLPVANGVNLTFPEPLGVVGLIAPWNFPMMMAAWKIGPAIAAGNTAVLKPAEITPLTSVRLGELALAAGIPEGVVNVVVGSGQNVGWRFVEHPDVRKVSFTGSTEVGRRIMAGCAEQVKRVTLELGGKSARTSSSPTPTWRRPLLPPLGRFSTTAVRTAAPAAASWWSARRTTGSWSCSSKRPGRSRSAIRCRRAVRWARW